MLHKETFVPSKSIYVRSPLDVVSWWPTDVCRPPALIRYRPTITLKNPKLEQRTRLRVAPYGSPHALANWALSWLLLSTSTSPRPPGFTVTQCTPSIGIVFRQTDGRRQAASNINFLIQELSLRMSVSYTGELQPCTCPSGPCTQQAPGQGRRLGHWCPI